MTGKERLMARYENAVADLPEPGYRNNYLPKITHRAVMLGLPLSMVVADIMSHHNSNGLMEREIEQSYQYSKRKVDPIDFTKPVDRLYNKVKRNIPKHITINPDDYMVDGEIEDLECISPITLGAPEDDPYLLIETLFKPDEFIYLGDMFGREVKQAKEWLNMDLNYPHISVNPLSGNEEKTQSGNMSYRCDAAVTEGRYALVEMDTTPIDVQARLWLGLVERLNVAAVIYSGNKSLHGWVRVNATKQEWKQKIKPVFFEQFMVPLGADPACKNISRMSRLPGYKRDTGIQKLLYLRGEK